MFSGHKEADTHFHCAASGDQSHTDTQHTAVPALICNDHDQGDTPFRDVVASGDHTIGGIQSVYVPALICTGHQPDDNHQPFAVAGDRGPTRK